EKLDQKKGDVRLLCSKVTSLNDKIQKLQRDYDALVHENKELCSQEMLLLRVEIAYFIGSGVEGLVRKLLTSDEFHVALTHVASLVRAKADFNKALVGFSTTQFPFLGKVVAAAGALCIGAMVPGMTFDTGLLPLWCSCGPSFRIVRATVASSSRILFSMYYWIGVMTSNKQNAWILKLKRRYFEDYVLPTNTPYPSRKIQRIRACTLQRPRRTQAQYAISSGKTTTQNVHDDETNAQPKEPLEGDLDKPIKSNKVLTNNQSQKTNEPVVLPSSKIQSSPVPFPRRLRKEKEVAQQMFMEDLKQLHFNLPFIKALAQMMKYAKFLKGLLKNKAKLEEACKITINERCSVVLLNKLPSKEKDPGSFTIPCDIGQLHIDKVIADLEASISLMPYKIYKKLSLGELKATKMSLELADRIDDLDDTINIKTEELLANEEPGSYLSRGLEKSIDQSYLESCESADNNNDDGFFQHPMVLKDQGKTTFTCPYGTFAYLRMPFGLCNAHATFQRCMTTIFHDMVKYFMEVFMDDFSEKCHFMVKEDIVLGHKIYGAGIEVDRSRINVIDKLPYPTNVKGVRSFLGHAGFYRRMRPAPDPCLLDALMPSAIVSARKSTSTCPFIALLGVYLMQHGRALSAALERNLFKATSLSLIRFIYFRSFGQALFKTLKSMLILQLLSGFFARIGSCALFPLHSRFYVRVYIELVFCNEAGNSDHENQLLIPWHRRKQYLVVRPPFQLLAEPIPDCVSSNHSDDGFELNMLSLFKLYVIYAFMSAIAVSTKVLLSGASLLAPYHLLGGRCKHLLSFFRVLVVTLDLTCPSTSQLLRRVYLVLARAVLAKLSKLIFSFGPPRETIPHQRGSSIPIDLFTFIRAPSTGPSVKKLTVHDSGDFMAIG
nr:reverse transcriptase domain-containing protein [Tanacetum cinerariifolium]